MDSFRFTTASQNISRSESGAFLLVVALALVAVISPQAAFAAETTLDSPTLFRSGLEDYDQGHLGAARLTFNGLIERLPPDNEWNLASRLMLARTFYRLGQFEQAVEKARSIIPPVPGAERWPRSTQALLAQYTPYARYLIALTNYRAQNLNEIGDIANQMLDDRATPNTLSTQIKSLFRAVVADADVEAIEGVPHEKRRLVDVAAALNTAHALYAAGRLGQAHEVVEALEINAVDGSFWADVLMLRREISSALQAEIKIAVLSAHAGPDSALGAQLRDGVAFAINAQRPRLISDVIQVDVRNELEAIYAVQQLGRNRSVVAVIGPVRSDQTICAAAVAQAARLPLVAPTASRDGIAGIGDFVFQFNPPLGWQGRKLADFAIDSLGAYRAATLSSPSTFDQAMAKHFADRIVERGGEVLIQEVFFSLDMSKQLVKIRQAGLEVDSVYVAMRADLDSLELEEPIEEGLDTAGILHPVTTIDAILVASADTMDLISAAPQVVFQKLVVHVLGGDTWGKPAVRHMAGENVEDIIFASPFDEQSAGARRFTDRYRIVRREDPTYVTALGYDAGMLVAAGIGYGYTTRRKVREYLTLIRRYFGASGEITIGKDGANSAVAFLTIRGGKIVPANSRLRRAVEVEIESEIAREEAEKRKEERGY